jgi:hypothetical protein
MTVREFIDRTFRNGHSEVQIRTYLENRLTLPPTEGGCDCCICWREQSGDVEVPTYQEESATRIRPTTVNLSEYFNQWYLDYTNSGNRDRYRETPLNSFFNERPRVTMEYTNVISS